MKTVRTLSTLSFASTLSILSIACAGDGTTDSDQDSGDGDRNGDGGTPGASGGSENSEGSGGGTTTGSGGSSNRADGVKYANLTFAHTVNEYTIPFTGTASIIASVVNPPDPVPCIVTTTDYCELKVCTSESDTVSAVITRAEAGDLTLKSSDLEGSVLLSPDADSRYEKVSSDLERAGGGETMVLTASGGAISGFTREFTFPLSLVVENPTDDSGYISSAPGAAVTINWQDRGEDSELYIYGAGLTGDRGAVLTCNIPSSLETYTLDAATMSEFPSDTKIQLHVAQSNHFIHEDYDFAVYFVGPVTNPAKDGYVYGIRID